MVTWHLLMSTTGTIVFDGDRCVSVQVETRYRCYTMKEKMGFTISMLDKLVLF